jgi:TetR/AcrR family transcriptional regulator
MMRSPAAAVAKRNPEQTKERILAAAIDVFSSQGLSGARVDAIAERAGANKRMIYHYFGNKDQLFVHVLEAVYGHIRSHERELHLDDLDPKAAMRELVRYTFDYFRDNPHFIKLLNTENLYEAAHLKTLPSIRDLHMPLTAQIKAILDRGVAAGVFRKGVDPVQLYISIAGVGYFYHSNVYTLSTIFGRPLGAKAAIDERREHVIEVILGYLRVDGTGNG